MTSTDQIIAERKNSHGEFRDVAAMDDGLVTQMTGGKNWNALDPYVRVSLRMIQHKVSRILSGDPAYLDHWDDIIGYAKITRDRIDGKS